jgi:hypothetical protein
LESAGGRRRKGEGVADRWAPHVSVTPGRRKARAILGRRLRLGSAHAEESRRGEKEEAGRGKAGRDGPKSGISRLFFSFSFSNFFSKPIFKRFSNPNLNLNQTTHLKNLNATA